MYRYCLKHLKTWHLRGHIGTIWHTCEATVSGSPLSRRRHRLGPSVRPQPLLWLILTNVCTWLKRWYPIVRNFLLLIQSHANCWGGPLLWEIFSRFDFFKKYFFPNALTLKLSYFFLIIFLFMFNYLINFILDALSNPYLKKQHPDNFSKGYLMSGSVTQ